MLSKGIAGHHNSPSVVWKAEPDVELLLAKIAWVTTLCIIGVNVPLIDHMILTMKVSNVSTLVDKGRCLVVAKA